MSITPNLDDIFAKLERERDDARVYAEALRSDLARILDLCYGKPTLASDGDVVKAIAAIADDARVRSPEIGIVKPVESVTVEPVTNAGISVTNAGMPCPHGRLRPSVCYLCAGTNINPAPHGAAPGPTGDSGTFTISAGNPVLAVGTVVVPVEPTADMMDAGYRAVGQSHYSPTAEKLQGWGALAAHVYRAMLNAAPTTVPSQVSICAHSWMRGEVEWCMKCGAPKRGHVQGAGTSEADRG